MMWYISEYLGQVRISR